VHRLRAQSGAIITGVGTVLADDPSFNVRLEAGALEGLGPDDPAPQPLRVVVDGGLRTSPTARMLSLPGEVAIACIEGPATACAAALTAAGARVVPLPARHRRVDLDALMAWLADREVNEVLIESGPTLAGSALTAGVVDELVLYLAPHLMGDDGRGLFHLPGLERMEHRIPLRIEDLRRIGPDLRLTLRPDRS
jgi:diaminohydroxyphosphoribosylaminopyrimidine deaminase/5-amino-6-(5-phosphoribosylamino)uracil reductase